MPVFRLFVLALISAILGSCTLARGQNTIHVPADQPTIQAGINAAHTGDTVLVAAGTYFENIDFAGKAITVTSSDGAAKTTIDGGNKGNTVTFQHDEPRAAVLSNFTITHGGTALTYDNAGSGVALLHSRPTLLNNVITANYCQNIYSQGAAPLIQGNVISASLTPERCGLEYTGGIYLGGPYQSSYPNPVSTQSPIILGNTIENNTTGQLGDGGGDGGAGIAVWGGSPLIEGNIFRNNFTRTGSGGAINVVYGSGIAIVQNLMYGNIAGCGGGAIGSEEGGLNPDTYLLIANNTIIDDTGGLQPAYTDCRKSSEIWTSFYSGGGPSLKFVNNIIQANLTPALDCGMYNTSPDEAHQSLFDHNLFYNTAGPFFGANCTDVSHLHGNLVADPQFVNLAAFDLHLRPTSPAIDAGNGSVLADLKLLSGIDLPKDLDGNPREQDTTGKGHPVIDIGAYEFAGAQNASPTRIVLSSSALSGPASSNYVLMATLSSSLGVPTGTANFYLDGQPAGSAVIQAGVATLNNFSVKPGVHTLYAAYDGQAGFVPAVSVYLVLDIDRYGTTLSLTATPTTSITGQTVLLAVHTASSDGTYVPTPIQLADYTSGSMLATLTPDAFGNASFSTASLSLGGHSLQASYAGDTLHATASASAFEVVSSGYSTMVTLNSSPNPSSSGQPVTFAARVTSPTGTPTGTVQFLDGNILLGNVALDPGGNAGFSTASLGAGTHRVTATYNPTGGYAGSSASVSQVVNGLPARAMLTATPLSLHAGDPVTITVAVSAGSGTGTPTGSVSISSNGSPLGTSVLGANGATTLAISSLPTGTNALTCTYSGDAVFSSANCNSVSVMVQAADTAIALLSSLNPTPALSPVTFTANLTSGGRPTPGAVVFLLDGTPVAGGIPGAGGFTSLALSLSAGVHAVTARFSGSSGLNASSATVSETVQANPTASTLGSPAGPTYQNQQISLGAMVRPLAGTAQPYGSVTLFDGATPLSVQGLAAGQSAAGLLLQVPALAPGTHLLSLVYTPADANFLSSTSPAVSITVLPQALNLTASASGLTIQAEHHGSMQLTLTSVGGWSGPVQLGCGSTLPPHLTCEVTPGITLAANSRVNTTLTLDTDAVLNFRSSVTDGEGIRPAHSGRLMVAWASLLMPLICLRARRGRNSFLRLFLLLGTLAGLGALQGCSGRYPDHTPPGTYTLTVTANGIADGATAPSSSSVQIQLVVTP